MVAGKFVEIALYFSFKCSSKSCCHALLLTFPSKLFVEA